MPVVGLGRMGCTAAQRLFFATSPLAGDGLPRSRVTINDFLRKDGHYESPLKTRFFIQFCKDMKRGILEKKPFSVCSHSLDNTFALNQMPGVCTLPSEGHMRDNQDRLEQTTLVIGGERTCVTTLSDGVSGNMGRAAAIHMTTQLNLWYQSPEFKQMLHDVVKEGVTKETVAVFREALHEKVKELSKGINPLESTTTLEIAFEINSHGKKYLISMSYGDSETILFRGDKVMQLNALMTDIMSRHRKEKVHALEDLLKRKSEYKPYSYPGGFVSRADVSEPTITFCELQFGDIYIVCSDGVGDAFSERTSDISKLSQEFLKRVEDFAKTEEQLRELLNSMAQGARLDPVFLKLVMDFAKENGLSESETAQLIVVTAVTSSEKRDDATVAVVRVKF